ncbi:unnamed protein product [Caenorhabditis nigoni]
MILEGNDGVVATGPTVLGDVADISICSWVVMNIKNEGRVGLWMIGFHLNAFLLRRPILRRPMFDGPEVAQIVAQFVAAQQDPSPTDAVLTRRRGRTSHWRRCLWKPKGDDDIDTLFIIPTVWSNIIGVYSKLLELSMQQLVDSDKQKIDRIVEYFEPFSRRKKEVLMKMVQTESIEDEDHEDRPFTDLFNEDRATPQLHTTPTQHPMTPQLQLMQQHTPPQHLMVPLQPPHMPMAFLQAAMEQQRIMVAYLNFLLQHQ